MSIISSFSVKAAHKLYVNGLFTKLNELASNDPSREMEICKSFIAHTLQVLAKADVEKGYAIVDLTHEEASVLLLSEKKYTHGGAYFMAKWSKKYGRFVYAQLLNRRLVCNLDVATHRNDDRLPFARIRLEWNDPGKMLDAYSLSVSVMEAAIDDFEHSLG